MNQTENQCPVFRKCGGCQLRNMEYPRQLSWKQGKVHKEVGFFCPVSPIIGMENPVHYRNKVQAAFGCDQRGNIVSGVYQASTHHIVSVEKCLNEDEKADEIIASVRALLRSFKMTAYDEQTEKGFLRHVLVKRGFATNEIMVVFVSSSPIFPHKADFLAALLKKHPEITTVVQNINPGFTSMVLGRREEVLYGNGFITDILCDKKFRISAKSFYQINPVQTQVLYRTAIAYAGLTGKETVLDAYCGIGTIGIVAADKAAQVIGVELNPDAIRDAQVNSTLNGTKNIRFECGDAGDFMSNWASQGGKPDVVFLDPPRAGSTTRFLSALCAVRPKKIVYVSCNPETLGRDLHYLCTHGYKARMAQPVDMFPHTSHVECVVLLTLPGVNEPVRRTNTRQPGAASSRSHAVRMGRAPAAPVKKDGKKGDAPAAAGKAAGNSARKQAFYEDIVRLKARRKKKK